MVRSTNDAQKSRRRRRRLRVGRPHTCGTPQTQRLAIRHPALSRPARATHPTLQPTPRISPPARGPASHTPRTCHRTRASPPTVTASRWTPPPPTRASRAGSAQARARTTAASPSTLHTSTLPPTGARGIRVSPLPRWAWASAERPAAVALAGAASVGSPTRAAAASSGGRARWAGPTPLTRFLLPVTRLAIQSTVTRRGIQPPQTQRAIQSTRRRTGPSAGRARPARPPAAQAPAGATGGATVPVHMLRLLLLRHRRSTPAPHHGSTFLRPLAATGTSVAAAVAAPARVGGVGEALAGLADWTPQRTQCIRRASTSRRG